MPSHKLLLPIIFNTNGGRSQNLRGQASKKKGICNPNFDRELVCLFRGWNGYQGFPQCLTDVSMTQLLSHTIAHFTGPSFMLKANNQPYKKFLELAFSWVNIVKNCKILTFKVNFLCQKLSESFQFFFSLNNINLGAHFLLLTFFDNFNL